MNILWLCVASLLHVEAILLTMLTIPWIPSITWSVIFKCNLGKKIQSYSKISSSITVGLLLVLFADSVRELVKYSKVTDAIEEPTIWAQNDIVITSSRLFRAERNFYLLGITLFLFLVIRRTVSLISREAEFLEKRDGTQGSIKSRLLNYGVKGIDSGDNADVAQLKLPNERLPPRSKKFR